MTPDECRQAVSDQAMVVFKRTDGSVYARGRVFAYSGVPVVYVIDRNGERLTWRHDLVERVDDE